MRCSSKIPGPESGKYHLTMTTDGEHGGESIGSLLTSNLAVGLIPRPPSGASPSGAMETMRNQRDLDHLFVRHCMQEANRRPCQVCREQFPGRITEIRIHCQMLKSILVWCRPYVSKIDQSITISLHSIDWQMTHERHHVNTANG
jgi:hypothetical protein